MMSTEGEEAVAADMCCACASCGIAAVDDIKLKDCDCDGGCDLVKCCSDDCQGKDRPYHEEECKKRLTELCDKALFTMPDESCYGECPICCLPLPLDERESRFMGCCSKIICNGCSYANKKREIEAGLEKRCPFCREPLPESQEESFKRAMKRVKKNDPVALAEMGKKRYLEGDYVTALEYYTKAAELGNAEAHYNLSVMYEDGQDVEKNKKKKIYHLEEAAIAGHHMARHNLGCTEAMNGRFERARKHFVIAANLGCNDSLKCLRQLHVDGMQAKKIMQVLFVHIRPLWLRQRVQKGRKRKDFLHLLQQLVGVKDIF
jgi:tetratricopeptide (TPR) repeat protein